MKRVKTAVITGATSGIGAAIARELVAAGTRVHLIGRNPARLAAAARAVPSARLAGVSLLDLGSKAQLDRFLEDARKRIRYIDVLIHAAGEYGWTGIGDAGTSGFDSLFDVNVRAPYVLTQGLLPLLERAGGQVVVINSSVVRGPGQGVAAYKATQHAMQGLIDSLRQDLNQRGIRVSSVFPGRTATPRMRRIYAQEGKRYDASKLMRAADVARLVVTLTELPARMEVTDVHVRSRFRY